MLTQTLPSKLYSCAQCSPLRHPLAALRIVRVSSRPFQPVFAFLCSLASFLVSNLEVVCARGGFFFLSRQPLRINTIASQPSASHRITLQKPTPFPDPWIAARRPKLGTDGRHSHLLHDPRCQCSQGALLAWPSPCIDPILCDPFPGNRCFRSTPLPSHHPLTDYLLSSRLTLTLIFLPP